MTGDTFRRRFHAETYRRTHELLASAGAKNRWRLNFADNSGLRPLLDRAQISSQGQPAKKGPENIKI
jgi:hypothetical protein